MKEDSTCIPNSAICSSYLKRYRMLSSPLSSLIPSRYILVMWWGLLQAQDTLTHSFQSAALPWKVFGSQQDCKWTKRCSAWVTALSSRGAKKMLSTTLLRSLLKNHLNMQHHQLKSSPVSDSASIPIQEATPKQRKSWLHLWDNYFPPFNNQSTCTGKDCHRALTLIALQKTVFFAPLDYCRSLGGENKCSCHFAGNQTPSSPPAPRQQEQSTKKTVLV